MSRKFIFIVVASAVAVTGVFAAPARASGEDIIKFIFGVATLAIIAEALDDDAPAVSAPPPPPPPPPNLKPRTPPLNNRYYAPIPITCVKYLHTRGGTVRLVTHNCVHRHYPHAHHFPKACRIKVNTYHGVYHGYNPRCLHNNGFRVAEH